MRVVRGRTALLGAIGVVLAAPASVARPAPTPGDFITRLQAAVHQGLDELIAAHAPKLVPPVPITPVWKAVRIGSVDLGAPLVAMTAGELDGDGKGELYAVTAREVIALGVANGKVKELARVAFSGALAVPAPRDVVGTAVVDGPEVVAAVSTYARELRVRWQGKALVGQPGDAGFLACPGERLALVPGRNHFGDVTAPLYAVRCRADLVDPEGAPLKVRAVLAPGKLEVLVERCRGATCQPIATHAYKDYGVALELADVDRDGRPEVIVTGAGAPGDPDAVKVMTLGGDEKKGLYRKTFTGGVAGVAVVDGDGNGAPEVFAVVRLVGATRVDVWRLD